MDHQLDIAIRVDKHAESAKHGVRLIALYLPQFHRIPENDAWWGEGFTDWTNVSKAKPLFQEHYQPHIPGELGYYDLQDCKVRESQAALAKQYGVYGFCYYHYWFNGKRLLETPLNEVLKSRSPDFPFCVCWANESWTRNWDGRKNDILLEQNHSESDDIAFISDLIPYFQDERYIRVNGKPVLIIYRTSLFLDPRRSAGIWRKTMIDAGIGDIYLVRVESTNETGNPEDIGFDAAMEFPSHQIPIHCVVDAVDIPDLPKSFVGRVFDYSKYVEFMVNRADVSYKRFKSVMPAWDNTARVNERAGVFVGSSPDKYEEWLSEVIFQTQEEFSGDEQLIFVNAWNEWGEGCHLEPDQKYGLKYLEATRSAMHSF